MTTFYLIRHGVTVGLEQGRLHGVSESDLSARGYRMAELTAEAMRGIPLERIYSSPLRRTLQTAEPLARVSGTAITPCAELIEMDFGWFEGTRDHFRALREKPLLRWLYRRARRASMALTGESMTRFERRVAETWQRLREEHPCGNVALVSHYGVIQQILLQSFGAGGTKAALFVPHPARQHHRTAFREWKAGIGALERRLPPAGIGTGIPLKLLIIWKAG